MKKRLIMLLALVMLFAAFSCPALASEPWDLLNSDLSEDYTSAWKVSGGSFGGAVTQEDGYVSIVKGDDKTVSSPTGGAYTWLVPQSLTLPESGKLTDILMRYERKALSRIYQVRRGRRLDRAVFGRDRRLRAGHHALA